MFKGLLIDFAFVNILCHWANLIVANGLKLTNNVTFLVTLAVQKPEIIIFTVIFSIILDPDEGSGC